MTPEELVDEVQSALPGRLCAAVLYGSAVAGDFVSGTSNYNVLLVLDRLALAEFDALARPVSRWARAGHRPPLLFTRGQLAASADVFPIELLDMQQSRRVLFGDDPLAGVTVRQEHLRLQLERELKGKLFALRQEYVLAGGRRRRVFGLMVSSLSGFLVLLRATLRLFQEDIPAAKLEALRLLEQHIPFDPQPLRDVYDLKYRRRKPREFSARALFVSYLTTIEKVVEAVDRHLHPEPREKQVSSGS